VLTSEVEIAHFLYRVANKKSPTF